MNDNVFEMGYPVWPCGQGFLDTLSDLIKANSVYFPDGEMGSVLGFRDGDLGWSTNRIYFGGIVFELDDFILVGPNKCVAKISGKPESMHDLKITANALWVDQEPKSGDTIDELVMFIRRWRHANNVSIFEPYGDEPLIEEDGA